MTKSENRKGILTKTDREYLRGNTSKEGAAERNTRKRIRERVRGGILDFSILHQHLEARDRAQILLYSDGESPIVRSHNGETVGPREIEWELLEVEGSETILMTGGLRSMCAFGFRSLLDTLSELDFFETEEVAPKTVIESLVEESLQDAYGRNGVVCDVSVDITTEVKDVDIDQIAERFEAGEAVSDEEVEYLIRTRRISFEQMVEYVRGEREQKDD